MNGGMLFHIGTARAAFSGLAPEGINLGLGGRAAFTVLPWLRLGGMGFSTRFVYATSFVAMGSYAEAGLGGLTAEFLWDTGYTRLSAGFMAGGGSVTRMHVQSVMGDSLVVRYESIASFVFSPLVMAEFPLTDSLSFAVMADWIFMPSLEGPSYGPRFHLGVLFNR